MVSPDFPRREDPELIPVEFHDKCLYDGFDGLVQRLRWAIGHIEPVRDFSLREHMVKFDWDTIASLYDSRLTACSDGPQ